MYPHLVPIVLAIVAVILVIVIILAMRNKILFRIGTRNINRRKVNTALVIIGSMIGTAIISASMVTGDTMDRSIKREVFNSLGEIDFSIIPAGSLNQSFASSMEGSFSFLDYELVNQLEGQDLQANHIESILPAVSSSLPVEHVVDADEDIALASPNTQVFGFDINQLRKFTKNNSLPTQLEPTQALLSERLAKRLHAEKNSDITITVIGQKYDFTVADIYPDQDFFAYGNNPNQAGLVAIVDIDKLRTMVTTPPTEAEFIDFLEDMSGALGGANGFDIDLIVSLALQQYKKIPNNALSAIYISSQGDRYESVEWDDQVDTFLQGQTKAYNEEYYSDEGEVYAEKKEQLEMAEESSAMLTLVFLVLGGFSTFAGVLLIINIFVMLAEERKTEMGILRAIGLRRSDLIKMFAFEGMMYTIFSSIIGSFFGLGIAYAVMALMERAINTIPFLEGNGFNLEFTFRWPSIINAFAIGSIITFISITLTSWRISRVNVIQAIRDIPKVAKPYFSWIPTIIAIVLTLIGLSLGYAGFRADPDIAILSLIGPVLIMLSVGLIARMFIRDRIVFSIVGLGIFLYSILGYILIDDYFSHEEIFIVGGILMVLSLIIIIINNDRLILWPIENTFGKIRSLRPIIKLVVTYPLRARFRTGMTLAMYSLIIFTVSIIAVIKQVQTDLIDTMVIEETQGYSLYIYTDDKTPIYDLEAAITENPDLDPKNYEDIIQERSYMAALDTEQFTDLSGEFNFWMILPFDDQYIEDNPDLFEVDIRDERFTTDQEMWDYLRTNGGGVVLDATFSGRRQGGPMQVPKLGPGDTISICPITDPKGCQELPVLARTNSFSGNILMRTDDILSTFDTTAEEFTISYRVKLAAGVDKESLISDLELAFASSGITVFDLENMISGITAFLESFFTLMQGFLAVGLIVGITGLGVIMIRSVHERRQQIGILRALGYRRSSVLTAFLAETSFIAILGILIGTVLGITVAYFLYKEQISDFSESTPFTVPWIEILVIVSLSYIASILATLWPSKQASHLSPAEVLRYHG